MKYDELTIGTVLWDMHYGMPEECCGEKIETRHYISVNVEGPEPMLALLSAVKGHHGDELHAAYTNKMAVVVGYDFVSCGSWWTAAYCYDGRRFCLFQFRRKPKEQNDPAKTDEVQRAAA